MTGCCGVGISIVHACGRAPRGGETEDREEVMLERVETVRGGEPAPVTHSGGLCVCRRLTHR